MSVSVYADNEPVLATAAYVQDAYRQAMMQVSLKQDIWPMTARPVNSGRYNVVWNAASGQFIFEKQGVDNPGELQCDAGLGMYDLGFGVCISENSNGKSYGWYAFDGAKSNASQYGLITPGTWAVTFDYGDVSGVVSCNSTNGTYGADTDKEFDNTSSGYNCWCKMTYPATSKWVFSGSASSCAAGCTNGCGYYFETDVSFRSALLKTVNK